MTVLLIYVNIIGQPGIRTMRDNHTAAQTSRSHNEAVLSETKAFYALISAAAFSK